MLILKVSEHWEIGCFSPDGIWHSSWVCTSILDAMDKLHYLNGGK